MASGEMDRAVQLPLEADALALIQTLLCTLTYLDLQLQLRREQILHVRYLLTMTCSAGAASQESLMELVTTSCYHTR